jgi:hypothetical protein
MAAQGLLEPTDELEPIKDKKYDFNQGESFVTDVPNINPSNQDWAKGDLQVRDDGVFFTPQTAGVTGPASVEGRMEGLLGSDSPYMKAAKAGAMETANRRGLLNSTMAATAGEKAAIESALPIAQADAGFLQQSALQSQQGNIQKGLYETQGDISSRLGAEEGERASALSAQEHEQQSARQQADIAWKQIDLSSRMQIEYDRLDQQNKDRFDATASGISESYMKDYLEIMLNPNFASAADRQKAIDVLNEVTQNRYEVAGTIAGITLDWPGTSQTAANQGTPVKVDNPANDTPLGREPAPVPTYPWNQLPRFNESP